VDDTDLTTARKSAAIAAAHAEMTIADTAVVLAGQLETASDQETVDRLKTAAEALDYLAISVGRRHGPQGGHTRSTNTTDYMYRSGGLGAPRAPAGFAAANGSEPAES
jgi:hypothetical protein